MRLELLEYQYEKFLREQLPGALAAEEAYWAAYDPPKPLTLLPIQEWHTGHIPLDVLFNWVQRPPAIIIEAQTSTPADDLSDVATLIITVITLGSTPSEANQLNHRYCHAISTVINGDAAGDAQDAGRGTKEIAQTITEPSRMAYIKGAQVSFTVRVDPDYGEV